VYITKNVYDFENLHECLSQLTVDPVIQHMSILNIENPLNW